MCKDYTELNNDLKVIENFDASKWLDYDILTFLGNNNLRWTK
jgi:hypothetical protein